jgi:hypothetical protein
MEGGFQCGYRLKNHTQQHHWTKKTIKGQLSIYQSDPNFREGIELPSTEGKMARRMVRSVPDRKSSETFLHLAAPLINVLPNEAPEDRAREAPRCLSQPGTP